MEKQQNSQKYAIAMWEFSWLVRRQGQEAEYKYWDKVLDELAERGYNCVRIDAFPHLISDSIVQKPQRHFTILPQGPRFMWGNHTPVEVEPASALINFIEKAHSRGIKIGLSSWFNDDSSHRRKQIITPQDYAAIWLDTLNLLNEHQLHDAILWVDLCNEFPIAPWAPGAYKQILKTSWPNIIPLVRRWTEETQKKVEIYFTEAIATLRHAYPNLRYTFSYQGLIGGSNFRHLNMSSFDILEPHIWLSNNFRFNFFSGQFLALLETPGSGYIHRLLAPIVYQLSHRKWLERLEKRMDAWVRCAEKHNLPLYTTEGWASTNYEDAKNLGGKEWNWVKDLCARAVAMAVDKGWQGICSSNFCQPHFPGMWNDIEWHKQVTKAICK